MGREEVCGTGKVTHSCLNMPGYLHSFEHTLQLLSIDSSSGPLQRHEHHCSYLLPHACMRVLVHDKKTALERKLCLLFCKQSKMKLVLN